MTRRLVRLADGLSSHPTKSIPVACTGPAEVKAAYRLLDAQGGLNIPVFGRWIREEVL